MKATQGQEGWRATIWTSNLCWALLKTLKCEVKWGKADFFKGYIKVLVKVCQPTHLINTEWFLGTGTFFFNKNLFILIGGKLLYRIVVVLPYIDMNLPQVYMCFQSWTPSHRPPHPIMASGPSQCTSPEHPVSFIKPGLAIHFTYDNICVSMPFSQIIPPLPSPGVQKTVLYICASFAVSHIELSLQSF